MYYMILCLVIGGPLTDTPDPLPAGSLSQTPGFTLSRVLKKTKAKYSPQQEDSTTTVVNPLAQEGTNMEPLSRERSDSQHSSHSLTTGL